MELTKYAETANLYIEELQTAVEKMKDQNKEIHLLKNQVTELTRSNYRLLDRMANQGGNNEAEL